MSTTTTNKDGDYCMRNIYVNNNNKYRWGLLYEEHLSTTTNKDGDYCMRNTYVNNNKKER